MTETSQTSQTGQAGHASRSVHTDRPSTATATTTPTASTAGVRLRAEKLCLAYGERTVVHDLDLDIPDGSVTAVIGPNGCGKSTLLRSFGRLLRPKSGHVLLDGSPVHTLPTRRVAGTVGLLPQSPEAPEGITVADLVARGRHPHQSWYRRWSSDDEAAVEQALRSTGTYDLAERTLDELSGGQRQRAWIAMALAQETPILLLDEPTTYLDIAHQFEVLELLKDLNRKQGRTIVMVVHDLNHAAQYADHIVAVANGGIHAAGRPADLLTPDLIKVVFGIDAVVIPHPVDGTPLCLPLATKWHVKLRRVP